MSIDLGILTGAALHPGFTYVRDGKIFSHARIYSGTATGNLEGSFRMTEDMVLDQTTQSGNNGGTIFIRFADGRVIYCRFKGIISPGEAGTLRFTGRWSIRKAARKDGGELINATGNGKYEGAAGKSGFFKISITGRLNLGS